MLTLLNWRRDRYITHSRIFIALCLFTLCLLAATQSFAKSYSFAWSANPEPVTGYKLYYKKGDVAVQNFVGTGIIEGASLIDVGKKTTYTISGLEENATYYFALKAYNGTDESANSNIISVQPYNFTGNFSPQAIALKLNPEQAAVATPKGFAIAATTSITQYGITWTFAEPVVSGQFVNGDYWVVDPGPGVRVTNITPGYGLHPTDTTRRINGSMLNPVSSRSGGPQGQGYDGIPSGASDYREEQNVGIGISSDTPLVLTGNSSLVSTISNDIWATGNASYVKTAAVLTSLSTVPPSGSFRPGISSLSKTLHNVSSINTTLLKSFSYPGTKPDINTYASYFKMLWLDHYGGYMVRFMHPSDNGMSNYYYPTTFADAALLLHLDYTNEEKHELLINFIQMGIDLYSFLERGENGWPPDGGHSQGRKWPILFAGLMLNYSPMKEVGAISGDYLYSTGYGPGNIPPGYIHFGEDGQTFYVKQLDVDITNGLTWSPDTRNPGTETRYSPAMIGMPEWGILHSQYPQKSDASWKAFYRDIGSGSPNYPGVALTAMFMDAKTLWNNNAFFDYADRYMALSRGKTDPFGYTVPDQFTGSAPDKLIQTVWDAHRLNYPSGSTKSQ
ncbi:MAG: fibronectin type III domain-containing protein [Desulfobulbus sp.]|nr:fibronectin type III domain-containing protein [Desulfobulbus sp.]